MHNGGYSYSVSALAQLGPMRVWSLLVTVFGDLSQGEPLEGPAISAIMAEIGIKPEATRVALHRLRSDGWITSQRSGRTSVHRLTAKGHSDSAAASTRIYGRPEDMGRGIQVFLAAGNGKTLDPAEYAQISARVFVSGADSTCPSGAMALQPMDLPPWLGAQIETRSIFEAYVVLQSVLSRMVAELRNGPELTPLQIAVLRVLVVHAWRRLALKHPDLPRGAHSAGWCGHDCRKLVTSLLDQFERPAHDAIKAA